MSRLFRAVSCVYSWRTLTDDRLESLHVALVAAVWVLALAAVALGLAGLSWWGLALFPAVVAVWVAAVRVERRLDGAS